MMANSIKIHVALLLTLTSIIMYSVEVNAIRKFNQFLCRNPLNFATTERIDEDKYSYINTNPVKKTATNEDNNYIQLNFNIMNSEGIKGFIRSKTLERLIFTTMQDLHCAGHGDRVYYMYTMPYWSDNNPYNKKATQLSTNIPQYYVKKYYGCDFEKHYSYYTPSSPALRLLKVDKNGTPLSPVKKSLQIVHANNTSSPQYLCPSFSYKYKACSYYDNSTDYNNNSTKLFKREFSITKRSALLNNNSNPTDNGVANESVQNTCTDNGMDETIESITYPYGTGYVYGSKPSPLIIDMNINYLDPSIKNFSKYTFGLHNDDYVEKDLTALHDTMDKRATTLESHTYTGSNFYDGRSDIDYNSYLKNKNFITNHIDFRIPPFNVRGSRPIFEQFSYQFNLKRDLLASLAYASDTRFHRNSCDKEKKVNVVYETTKKMFNKDGSPVNATLNNLIDAAEEWHAKKNSENYNCWGDDKATKVLITIVSDEPQDYSSNLDIMWRMYKSHYELSGYGPLDDRIRNWEKATGHKFVDFSTRIITPENFNRELALEQMADTIVDRDIRHIVLVIESKNSSPYTKFVRKKTTIDSGPDDYEYDDPNNLFRNSIEYSFYTQKYKDPSKVIDYKDSSPPITALDYIIGYHGANVYSKDTRRLLVKETIKNLEEIGMGRSLQALVLKNGGYFSVFLAKNLQIKPFIDYSDKYDEFTLFDLIESATAFRKITFKTPLYQRNRSNIDISPYKPLHPGNNRTTPKPLIPSYYNPRYNPILKNTPNFEKLKPVCYDYTDIEDLLTRILLAGVLYDTNFTSVISLLISQALHNAHNFGVYLYEDLPIHKMMETFYHEPIIIANKHMVFNGKSPYYITNLCSDKDEILKRGYSIEEQFEAKLKESMPCQEDDPKNCENVGFIIKLVHYGFDKYVHRPNYKAKILPFCADKPSCPEADTVPFNYVRNTIGTNLSVDTRLNPFTLRSKLEYMRVYNAHEFYLASITELEIKTFLYNLVNISHIPDTFYFNPEKYDTLKNTIPQRLKDHFNKGIVSYSTAINNGYAYARNGDPKKYKITYQSLFNYVFQDLYYKTSDDLPQVIKFDKDNPVKVKHSKSVGLNKILKKLYPGKYTG